MHSPEGAPEQLDIGEVTPCAVLLASIRLHLGGV